jgi:hypothetical protein
MFNNVQGTLNTPNPTAADTPQPDAKLSPEAAVAQLRAIRTQLPDLAPLTPKQRRTLLKRAQMPQDVLQASISVIGASDDVSSVIKQPVGDVHALQDETNRWNTLEDELKALLNGVSGANLIRRQRLALIAGQAYAIGTQLARDPANVLLVPHVTEIKRLKKLAQRKKPAQTTPQTPQTTPGSPVPAPQPPAPQHLFDTPEFKT